MRTRVMIERLQALCLAAQARRDKEPEGSIEADQWNAAACVILDAVDVVKDCLKPGE